MAETVYIKIPSSTKVNKFHVVLGDVAKVYSKDKCLIQKLKPLKIYTFHNPKKNRVVISSMKIIEIICSHFPNLDVVHMGEADFLLEYEPLKCQSKFIEYIKVALCCILIFFGSAFTIMTFNTDVSMAELFTHIYEDLTGQKRVGVTILEISYSIGIGLGIIIFYNHFGKKRLSNDPTPIELEMRKYETDIQEALIEGVNSKEEHIDVD
jgi:stage V sporulation protein AA